MRCKYFSAIGLTTSLLLMALPCGVTLRFRDPIQVQQYSYLSPTPILCGNWFPILQFSLRFWPWYFCCCGGITDRWLPSAWDWQSQRSV